MSKIIVFIENNKKELRFDTCIIKPAGSIMTKIPFEEGYWTFDMIEEKLGKQYIYRLHLK